VAYAVAVVQVRNKPSRIAALTTLRSRGQNRLAQRRWQCQIGLAAIGETDLPIANQSQT
jgi:hypothetical protein